ncbi:helix-turn-helix domain-containing protein [Amantichitinum ursilacus]|uniref:Transcriptional repressor DicA n=1 Tax=Amantichitinum ursilacus TaxID=857265 RepID=A0A0N0GPJ6_9NEIS|nr:helix-turn-helix domain-containing protein [Amantichitinum ursilacus]KPC53548.1 transcriptional repressor DicA [Amantichitinum ursilacus]
MNTLGSRISMVRKIRKRSQGWLADRLHVTQPSVSAWESDEADPTLTNLMGISSLLGASTDWLLTGMGTAEGGGFPLREPLPLDPEEQALIDAFQDLNRVRRHALLHFLQAFTHRHNVHVTRFPPDTTAKG